MRGVIAILLAFALCPERASAQTRESLRELLALGRCPLAANLQAVYERPAFPDANRQFIAVRIESAPQSYVRCRIGGDEDRQLHCEASSLPFATPQAGKAQAAARAALAKLGFATESTDRDFPYRRALGGPPDFDAIATLMLAALHDGYGARTDTRLIVDAPFAGAFVSACRY